MGSCFSCRRRTRSPKPSHSDTDPDREPLLPSSRHSGSRADALPPPRTALEKVADVVAALNAGKLPSQAQVDEVLRRVLSSGLLNSDSVEGAGESGGIGGEGEGEGERELGEAERRVVGCVREACQAVLQFGMEKNDDDRIQEIVYQLRKLSTPAVQAGIAVETVEPGKIDADAIAQELPTQHELTSDASTLLRSAFQLLAVLATSTAFRLVLSDVLLIARETAADVAGRVERVAAAVERAAGDVEERVRPGGGTGEEVREVVGEVGERLVEELGERGVVGRVREVREEVMEEGPERVREATIRRLQEAMQRAHANPSFQAALRTILALFRKYAAKVRTAVAVASTAETPAIELAPVISADPQLLSALADVKVLLERAAGGRSLDPLLGALSAVVVDVVKIPADTLSGSGEEDETAELREWFTALGAWLDNALADASYATSDAGREHAGELYDRARAQVALARSADPEDVPGWLRRLRTLLDETDAFIFALEKDRTTHRLVTALSALSSFLTDAGATVLATTPGLARARAREAKQSAIKGVVAWLLPRFLRAVNAIPMPRVEYVDRRVEVAVDGVLVSAPRGRGGMGRERGALGVEASLVPERVRLEVWNETVVEVDNAGPVGSAPARTGVGTAHASGGLMSFFAGTAADHHPPPHPRTRTRTQTQVQTHTRTRARLHVDGLRLAAHDVGFYVRYKGLGWVGYEDEGVVSVGLGEEGRGLGVDVEVEFDMREGEGRGGSWMDWFTSTSSRGTASQEDEDEHRDPRQDPPPLFRLTSLHVSLPTPTLHLTHTRHWLLNALLVRPLAGAAVKWVLERQLGRVVEGVTRAGGRVVARVGERVRVRREERGGGDGDGAGEWEGGGTGGADGGWEDWVWEVGEEVGGMGKAAGGRDEDEDGDEDEQEEGEESEDEEAPLIETHTRATAKGIVRQTITHPPAPSSTATSGEAEESVLAIGIAPQILPGKGVPYTSQPSPSPQSGLDGVKTRTAEEARAALEDVAEGEERVEREVRRGVEGAQRVREEVGRAVGRVEVRRRGERGGGWRSRVFDL
ncbi:hypothetical protein OH77DRAFT_1589761 [Trametes cingulata]|nr:hypothetical protein OH77DRAFT_1589761 [Trametes cingulata]